MSETGWPGAAARSPALRKAAAPRIAILADDLTSAGDGAAPFRAAGFAARIRLIAPCADEAAELLTHDGVVAIDLDTRAGSAIDAGLVTRRAAAALAGADIVFKTVDSTVRGHLSAEIDAALAVSGRHTAIIAPAFPEEGRTTVGGVQLLGGVPVHATAFARDPVHPVRDADLRNLIPGAVLARADASGFGMARLVGEQPYVVADAETDADLDRVVAQVDDPRTVLWVGSAGLAKALARNLRRLAPPTRRADDDGSDGSRAVREPSRRRVLVVVGSLHPASRQQASRLGAVIGGPIVVRDASLDAVEATARTLKEHGTALLYRPDEHIGTDLVPDLLADVTARLAGRAAFDALVVTGGQSARAVLLRLGARSIELLGEPEPGVALGSLDRPAALPVILKAGGFGDERTLVRLSGLPLARWQ